MGLNSVLTMPILPPLTSPQLLSPEVPPFCSPNTLDLLLFSTCIGPYSCTVVVEGPVGRKDVSFISVAEYAWHMVNAHRCLLKEWMVSLPSLMKLF